MCHELCKISKLLTQLPQDGKHSWDEYLTYFTGYFKNISEEERVLQIREVIAQAMVPWRVDLFVAVGRQRSNGSCSRK